MIDSFFLMLYFPSLFHFPIPSVYRYLRVVVAFDASVKTAEARKSMTYRCECEHLQRKRHKPIPEVAVHSILSKIHFDR